MQTRRGPAWGVVALAATAALGVSASRARANGAENRTSALARAFATEGLELDRDGVVWLEQPPLSVWRAAAGSVAVVARARTGAEEPHDIYLVQVRLSPEGVLLSMGRPHDISDTTAVDERRPVGRGSHVAYADDQGVVRLIDLAGDAPAARARWSRLERAQGAITRLQDTGRLSGVARTVYEIVPQPKEVSLAMTDGTLRLVADGKVTLIPLDRPLDVPETLGAKRVPESTPGNLVTWAVDRVRAEVGDDAMQYVKAVAFSALDLLKRGREAVGAEGNAAEQIAADLGAASLDGVTPTIPVDADIGFPPPPLDPVIKPALKGEGVWQAREDDAFVQSLPGLPPTFVTTYLRSDPTRRTSVVHIAMWDPRVVQLHAMAGVVEPKSATGATGPGMIPREPAVMKRMCAAMNAGFQALHGEFGMMSDGVVYLPPKPYGATVVELRDGSTGFGTWPEDAAIPSDVVSYRQNMTPMVLDQKFNPYQRTWWGGTPPGWEDKTHTVRTGICQTKEDFVAYFYGDDLGPEALAQSMIHTRCRYGIALDMNSGHSGMEFYKVAPAAELGDLGRSLDTTWEREGDVFEMEGWRFRARRLIRGMGLMNFPRYIQREGRDFFYLTMRHVLPGSPIAVSGGKAGDGEWKTKGLPQHGFPYAVARTEVPLAGRRAVVLRIDPRMLTRDGGTVDGESTQVPPVVLRALTPGEPGENVASLWFSPAAFSIGPKAEVGGAVRLASATATDRAVAALGVEDESGHLVYAELTDPTAGPVGLVEFERLFARVGSSGVLGLAAPWPVLLGGDTDVALRAARLNGGSPVVLRRQAGPGSRRVFGSTPIVPLERWQPLQSRRVRYFKEPKDN